MELAATTDWIERGFFFLGVTKDTCFPFGGTSFYLVDVPPFPVGRHPLWRASPFTRSSQGATIFHTSSLSRHAKGLHVSIIFALSGSVDDDDGACFGGGGAGPFIICMGFLPRTIGHGLDMAVGDD